MQLHLISSTSREAMVYIDDLSGPHQSLRIIKNTTKIDPFPPDTFEKWLKLYCSGPRFLPRPNLPLHFISSTYREGILHICDPSGAIEVPKWPIKPPDLTHSHKHPSKVIKILLNSYPNQIICVIQSHPYPRRPLNISATPGAPVRAPNWSKMLTK